MRSSLVLAVPLLVLTAALASADPRTARVEAPVRAPAPPPEGRYLVITDTPMLGAFQRFVAWKRRQGVDAHLLEMDAIRRRHPAARDEAERVRLAIQEAHAAGVRWVLLGGDTEVIPTRVLHTEALGIVRDYACDLYFADLQGDWDADGDGVYGEGMRSPDDPGDGTDLVADVHLGRAPVRNAREAMTFVAKTIRHAERAREGRVVLAAEILASVIDLAQDAERLLPHFDGVPGVVVERLYESFDDPRWRPGAAPLTESGFLAALASGPELVMPHLGGGPEALSLGAGDRLAPADLAALAGTSPAAVMWATLPSETHTIDRDAIAEAWVRVPEGGVVASIGTSYVNLVGVGSSTAARSVEAMTADGGGRVGVLLERHRGFLGTAALHEGTFHRASALSLLLLGDPQVELELGAPGAVTRRAPESALLPAPSAGDPARTIATVLAAPAVATPAHGIADAGAVIHASPTPAREFCELQLGRAVAGRGILVFDVAGRLVRRVEADAGGRARWDLADRTGHRVREGVYFARPASDLAAPVTRIVVAR